MAIEPVTPSVGTPPAAPQTPPSFTEAEVNTRIEAVRAEEKRKLYSELEALKNQLTTANLSAQEVAALKTQLTEAQQQLSAMAKAKTTTGEIDTIALARQVAQDTRSAMTVETQRELATMTARMAELEKANRQQQLAALRTQLIAEAQGQIIAGMVTGDSEEALRTSAQVAKAEYANIVASVKQPATPGVAPTPPPVINPGAVNGGAVPPAQGLDAVRRTGDPKLFSKNRQQVMADLKARFG